jgi:outer membrane protein assembly factor BamB
MMRADLLLLAMLAGCGARTGLALETTTDGGPLQDAASEQDGPAVVASGCEAALQAGAPTPMRGYCSTRANAALARAPTAPQVTWKLKLPFKPVDAAIEIVVDAAGRAYATFDTNSSDGWVVADTLAAVSPGGALLWTHSFGSQVPSQLFLAADGALRMRLSGAPPQLGVMGADGNVAHAYDLPQGQAQGFAVGKDGSLYTALWGPDDTLQVVKLTLEGSLLWKSESFVRCSLGTSPIALAPGDRAVVAFSASSVGDCTKPSSILTRVATLSPSGATAWVRDLAGAWAHDPAIAPDGAIRIAHLAGTDATENVRLASIDGLGTTVWDTDLQASAINVWESPMAIAKDGTTVVRTNGGIVAVNSAGKIAWKVSEDPMYYYDAVVDADGLLVVSDGDTSGIDSATGQLVWSLKGVVPPFVIGPLGSIVGTLSVGGGEFEMFLAGNP